MQYLAQVQKKAYLGGAQLLLLAQKVADKQWELLSPAKVIEQTELIAFEAGNLLLVTLDERGGIAAMEDATPWVLHMVSEYLSQGMTAGALAKEIERAEQWRQSLTLKSQEVDRRALETAARRDEIQELERNLKQEKEELERQRAELKRLADKLSQAPGSPD